MVSSALPCKCWYSMSKFTMITFHIITRQVTVKYLTAKRQAGFKDIPIWARSYLHHLTSHMLMKVQFEVHEPLCVVTCISRCVGKDTV